MDDSVKAYMAKIGAIGGAAGKGTKLRAKLNKRAARIRWARQAHKDCTGLNISPNKSPMKPLA